MQTTLNPMIPLTQIVPRTLDWLWPNRLALGKLAMFDGDPGRGKSLVTLDLCARVTTGRPMPDGQLALPLGESNGQYSHTGQVSYRRRCPGKRRGSSGSPLGAQTQRSHLNFPIGVERYRWGRAVIRALGILKKCAAQANEELSQLPPDKAALIFRASQEVIDGKLDASSRWSCFKPARVQTNMNANEVIANRAIQLASGVVGSKRPIHPNDDVNHSQSSNRYAHCDGRATGRRADACDPRIAGYARRQGRGVLPCGDGGPDAPPGCDALDSRPGDLGLGGTARPGAGRAQPDIARCVGLGDWRDSGRHRSERRPTLRRGDGAPDRGRDRQAVRLGTEQVRGPVSPLPRRWST